MSAYDFYLKLCLGQSSTVQGLQGRVESLEKSNSKLIEEVLFDFRRISLICEIEVLYSNLLLSSFLLQLAIAKNNIIKLQEENHQLRTENSVIVMKAQQRLEVLCVCLMCLYTTYMRQIVINSHKLII